ncbi:hypothetical protein EC991_008497 [Linnemannia zychae]|nr:hypothetical protein EC991_008497 [Linnemannia zychae]
MSNNRIVSSTIIRPTVDAEDDSSSNKRNNNGSQRQKRTFPDAPEPARRRRSISRSRSRSQSPHSRNEDHMNSSLGQTAGDRRPSLENASTAFRRQNSGTRSAGPTVNDRLRDHNPASTTPTTTTTTTSTSTRTTKEVLESGSGANAGSGSRGGGEEQGVRPSVKRSRTANANEDDTRRGKRMMGMILGTLTQFKRQQAAPRPAPAVDANANANAGTSTAETAAASTSTKSNDLASSATATTRKDDGRRDRSNERAREPRDTRELRDVREPRDARDPRDARSSPPTARAPALAPPVPPTADEGLRSREAVQERVREKLRLEKEANEERIRKERADREARLRETLLKQIAGRSSVPGRRRGPLGATGASSAATTAAGGAAAGPKVHASSRATRYDNGYLMTETRPRLRYMPKVMSATIQKEFERQVESNPDQRAIGSRHNKTPKPRRDISGDGVASQSRLDDGDGDDQRGDSNSHENEDGQPSAEAVAKAEAEAARELEAGMDMDMDGPSSFSVGETRPVEKLEEAQSQSEAMASGASSVTLEGSPESTSGRGEPEDAAME